MSSLYNEPITNFFHRVSSKEKSTKLRKRKRLPEDSEANRCFTPSDKKPKMQQKLFFSNDGHNKGSAGPSRLVAKTSSLKRGESSKSSGCSPVTPSPVDALLRVSSNKTPITHFDPLPTPLTVKRPALAQMTQSFLVPHTDQSTRTPGPQSPEFSAGSSHLKPQEKADLPTPATMPRRPPSYQAEESLRSRVRSLNPSRELSSPEPSQISTIYPQYEGSMTVGEGQLDDYSRDESPSPLLSQKLVPSSQSQADGCFESISLLYEDSEPSRSRRSSIFLVHRLTNRVTTGLLHTTDDESRNQTLCSRGKQLSSVPCSPVIDPLETTHIEFHDGEEYVLSSQSQLVLPFHVSPRKNRRKVSCSSSSSIPEDPTHFDEIVPSSQSQLEKELDVTGSFTDDRPHALTLINNSPLTAESWSQTHLAKESTAPFSFSEGSSTSTQILVEETPESYYDLPQKDEEPGSVTEEDSGDEGDNMFSPDQVNFVLTNAQESASSLSQESITMAYPSSLPDAIKEFREMFGIGDGSYPDDFPLSLRD